MLNSLLAVLVAFTTVWIPGLLKRDMSLEVIISSPNPPYCRTIYSSGEWIEVCYDKLEIYAPMAAFEMHLLRHIERPGEGGEFDYSPPVDTWDDFKHCYVSAPDTQERNYLCTVYVELGKSLHIEDVAIMLSFVGGGHKTYPLTDVCTGYCWW